MVAELLRLRLQTIANTVRFGPRALLAAVVSVLVVLLSSSALSALAGGLRGSSLDDVRALVVGGGSLLLLGYFVVPFARVRPPWADPRRLALVGTPEPAAAAGLALGALVGLPAFALVVLSPGYVRAWEGTGASASVAVVAAVAAGATAFLLSLVSSTLNTVVLTSRRSRQFLLGGGVLVALLVVPLIVDLVRASWTGSAPTGVLAGILAWTPFGAALALPGHAAEGDTARVVLDALIAAASLAGLWCAWRGLVARAFVDRPEPELDDDTSGLGWFEFVPATPIGAVAARSLTYWMRDARYRMSLVVIPIIPLLVIPLGIAGVSWNWLALVPVPLMCLIVGFLPHNDVAYDSTALWLHVAADTKGSSDRIGRLAPPLLIGIPLVVIGSAVAVWAFGDWRALWSEIGIGSALLLSGLGLSSVMSAAMPYATVRPHDDPFQQPQSSGSSSVLAQTLMIGGALVSAVPALCFAALDLFGGDTSAGPWSMVSGIAVGLVVLIVGVVVGSRVFTRRAPELLASALRS